MKELHICTGYELDGERIDHFPSDAFRLAQCKPILEAMPGWSEELTQVRTLSDLPANARKYIDRIRELVGLPISMVSVGPDRDQTIALS